MNLSATDLAALRDILVKNNVVPATASDGDVAAAHAALLSGPNATAYKASLEAGGVPPSAYAAPATNWLTWLGLAGGAVALYFIWQNYQKPKQISAHDYPEPDPRDRVRRMGQALRHSLSGARRLGRLRDADAGGDKYEFEPETRLEGYRRIKRKGKR